LQADLIVIGLNHRSAPVEVRERFWFSPSRTVEALQALAQAPGIAEVALLSTCNRTEFILWADEPDAASESVQAFLARQFALKMTEWRNFYRLAGEPAIDHVFRVTAGLDSMVVGEPEITGQVKAAWARAQQAGTTGRFLDAVFQKALNVTKRVRAETAIGQAAVSVPYAAVELAKRIFGTLRDRRVMILGAGKMSELSARYLLASGAESVHVVNRTFEHAVELAKELGGFAVPFEQRWDSLREADIILSSTGCPHVVFTREDAERMRAERHGRPVFLIDIAVPRDVDPAVRKVPGVYLYDIDDLEQVVARNLEERKAAAVEAQAIVARETGAFRAKLHAQRVVPTIVALRERLEQIRLAELERHRAEFGPLNDAEERAMDVLTQRMAQNIANRLAAELKGHANAAEHEQLATAVGRLFGFAQKTIRTQPASVAEDAKAPGLALSLQSN
jgi:glutamyl-tRNA reductase